jgi:hypothetical protein
LPRDLSALVPLANSSRTNVQIIRSSGLRAAFIAAAKQKQFANDGYGIDSLS